MRARHGRKGGALRNRGEGFLISACVRLKILAFAAGICRQAMEDERQRIAVITEEGYV
jgi:hypothetical protein